MKLKRLAAICTVILLGTHLSEAKPRTPLPPFPECTWFMERFDMDAPNVYFNPPILAEGVQVVDSWSGNAVEIEDGGFLAWNTDITGRSTIAPSQGTVRFWFSPSWTSGERSDSNIGTLLETVAYTQSPFALLSIEILPDGSGLAVSAGKKTALLGTPIQWQHGQWHQITLTYCSTQTVLYIDGAVAATGQGIQLNMKSRATFGFCLGSDINAAEQAGGTYDDICAFTRVLTPEEIANNFHCYAPSAALGPISPEEEAARESRKQTTQLMAAAVMQPLDLNASPMGLTSIDCTSGPLHLTNIVFISTNEVYVTIAGGDSNMLYDVYRTPALQAGRTNSCWTWIGQGHQCDTIMDTNAPADTAFYIAADTSDANSNHIADAYEQLILNKLGSVGNLAITITDPSGSFETPTNVTISATASNSLGSAHVDFYLNNQWAGRSAGANGGGANPFTMGWNDPIAGNYSLQAVITDGMGRQATSAIVNVSISLPAAASIQCWLAPEQLNLPNAGAVTNWPDISGHRNNATVAAGYAPEFDTNQCNGYPAVKFKGSASPTYLHIPTCLTTEGEAFVVLKPQGYQSEPLWNLSATTRGTYYGTNSALDAFGNTNAYTLTPTPRQNQFHIYNVSSRSNEWIARINGNVVASTFATTPAFGTNFDLGRATYIFGGLTTSYGRQQVAELLLYGKVLSDAQRLEVGRYLNTKFAIGNSAPTISQISCQGLDPNTIQVSWTATNAITYALSRQSGSQITQLLFTNGFVNTFTDSVASSDPITYQLTAAGYGGTNSGSLITPLMLFTAPGDESYVDTTQPLTVTLTPYQNVIAGFGYTFVPTRMEVWKDGNLYSTRNGTPWTFNFTNMTPSRVRFVARSFDSGGNSRFNLPFTVNVVEDIDSDGDGVPDHLDAFPDDPTRWQAPQTTNDNTAPIITITEP